MSAQILSAGSSASGASMAPAPDVPAELDTNYAAAIWTGLWLLILGFGGFLAWASLAPLDEGIPAGGVVSVQSNRKRIDHPNGGIIEQIKVREGQQVQAGEDLIVLNEIQSRSALNATLSQWYTAVATLGRLRAERDGVATVRFPPELTGSAQDSEALSAMRAQESLFASRRKALDGELGIIRESARGLEQQLASLEQLKAGREKQIALFSEQIDAYQKLRQSGFLSRNYLLEAERQFAEVQSKQSEDLSTIAGINARLSEFRMRESQRVVEHRREVESQLSEVQREVATLNERLAAQRDIHQRLVVRAPVSGTVVDLAFHTIGGVVKPGDRLMDVVPKDDDLMVEAKVSPQYVDRLQVGLPADVHFDAYANRIERPVITGTVAVVSADTLKDPKSGQSYYSLQVEVPVQELRKLGSQLHVQPGMPATVMVKTGERSLIAYLLRPLLRRFTTAMTE